jgi:hypothetical protein
MSESDRAALEKLIERLDIHRDDAENVRVALEVLSAIETVDEAAKFDAFMIVCAAARRLLVVEESAVPVKWCKTHDDKVMAHLSLNRCRWSMKVLADAAKKPCDISDAVIYPGEPK